MCFKLYLKNINRLGTSDIEWQSITSPSVANFDIKLEAQREGGGGGGYCHIWDIYVCAAGKGMVFQETDQLVEDFI